MIYEKFVKRGLDLLLTLLTVPFFLILLVFVSIAIKREDAGPIFYKSKRIGKNFKVFTMYKFRSMRVNAPNQYNPDGSTYNSKQDTRLTKVGKILRETSIDETPQIINVIKGEMSIIGPRPGDYESMDTYKEDEVGKMKVLPGITGYSQAFYRNTISVREKRLKDVWYSQHVSFGLDVTIFIKTIFTVLKREKIYSDE